MPTHALPPRSHLRALFGSVLDGDGVTGGFEIAVTYVRGRSEAMTRRYGFIPDLLDAASTYAAKGYDVFLGIHPRHAGSAGASTQTVAALTSTMVDIDLAKHGVSEALALRVLDETPWGAPSLVLHSGGGLHAFWVYREVLHASCTRSRAAHEQASEVARCYVDQALGMPCTDNCSKLTQSSRVPGTLNQKRERRAGGRQPTVAAIRRRGFGCEPSELLEWADIFLSPETARARSGRGASLHQNHHQPNEVHPTLLAVLTACGLRYSTDRVADGGISRLRLFACPACGAGRSCWLCPSTGDLRSFRQRGCPARAANGPLELKDWVTRYHPGAERLLPPEGYLVDPLFDALRTSARQEAMTRPSPEVLPWADVAEVVREAFEDASTWAMEKRGRVAVLGISPPGAGKTTEALRSVLESHQQSHSGAILLFPSHQLAAEKLEQAEGILQELGQEEAELLHVKGLQKLCPHGKGVGEAYARGYVNQDETLHMVACSSPLCEYTLQMSDLSKEVVKFGTHAHLEFLPAHGCGEGNLVVVDELAALSGTTTIWRRDLLLAYAPERSREILAPLREASLIFMEYLSAKTEEYEHRVHPCKLPPHERRVPISVLAQELADTAARAGAQSLEDALEKASRVRPSYVPAPPREVLRGGDLRDCSRADMGDFFAAVLAELRDDGEPRCRGAVCLVLPGKYGGTFRFEWRRVEAPPTETSLVILDATAVHAMTTLGALLPDREIKLYERSLAMPGPKEGLRSFHIPHQSLTRSKLYDEEGRLTQRGEGSIRSVLRLVKETVGPERAGEVDIAVTAHQPLVGGNAAGETAGSSLKQIARSLGMRGQIRSAYHFGLRGTNALKEPSVFINIGDPIKNLGALKEEARLFGIDPGRYTRDCASAELIQTLHRSRAFRVTPEAPKTLFHAGRMSMPGFDAQQLSVPHHRQAAETNASWADLARKLYEAEGVTAHWMVRDLASEDLEKPSEETLRLIWKHVCEEELGLEQYPMPSAGRGRPRKVWARGPDGIEEAVAKCLRRLKGA